MPGFEHALSLAEKMPNLGIGIHLTLTCGRPLLATHKTIVDAEGNFKKLSFYEENTEHDLDEVYREWDAQINRALVRGLKPTHLDSHHHIHTFCGHDRILEALATKYNLPIRGNYEVGSSLKHTEAFEWDFDSVAILRGEALNNYLKSLEHKIEMTESLEIMCHPGYLDQTVIEGSRLLENRTRVVDFLTSDFFKTWVETRNIKLGTYNNL